MKTFSCQCGNRLFFENVQCVACGRVVGWCEGCGEIASFSALNEGLFTCDLCRATVHHCHNYQVEQVCNRLIPISEGGDAGQVLCRVCELTETIPDLTVQGNRDKWRRLEQAKRRLIYQLDTLNLPYRLTELPLSFDFKGNVFPADGVWRKGEQTEHVYTGHSDGKITINIQEADDVEREKLRVDMNETHRTLIGHLRHEIGHYYWQMLILGKEEEACVALFGDHNNPDYATALAQYYEQGPRQDWSTEFVSAYATAHPWEDFAETFALYLDVQSVLHTAKHLDAPLSNTNNDEGFDEIIGAYQKLGIVVNELNRCLGIFDLVPEVIAVPVVRKLNYIHDVLRRAGQALPNAANVSMPRELQPNL